MVTFFSCRKNSALIANENSAIFYGNVANCIKLPELYSRYIRCPAGPVSYQLYHLDMRLEYIGMIRSIDRINFPIVHENEFNTHSIY